MIRRSAALAALVLCTGAVAADFASVGTAGAVLYDGPSQSARRIAVAPRGMPIELLSLLDRWVKARDLTGQAFWLDRADVSQQRTVITTMTAAIRSAPQDTAELLFQAERGVLLDLVEPAPAAGWVRVRHDDGTTGYVRRREIWGL